MRKFKFEKLVRDKIAESIEKTGGKVNKRILKDEEFLKELKKKILEEAQELPATKTKKETLDELSDLQELINTILKELGYARRDLRKIAEAKEEKAGGFKKRIYIKTAEVPDKSKWVKYYKENKDRYPEIKS